MSSAWTNRIAARALSRTRDFYGLARRYVESNANDDHGRAGREDYSVLLLAPAAVTLTVTQPAYAGPWTQRAAGTAATASATWTPRATGTATTASTTWMDRATGATTTATMTFAPRATGTATTANAAWATRRTGTATS